MGEETIPVEICPYSEPPYGEFTDDHIFPQFLGGRRTVRVCAKCNNSFGHTFEGRASRQLKRLQVFISTCGLDLTRNTAVWPQALQVDDRVYDLESGPGGVEYVLAKPHILRNEEGRVFGGQTRSLGEAKKLAKGITSKGAFTRFSITEGDNLLPAPKIELSLSLDEDIFRLATKMAAALLVYTGFEALVRGSELPEYLHGADRSPALVAYCDVSAIRALRKPLTHTIYVELGSVSYAVVLLFGCAKVFVSLPSTDVQRAFLLSLDPLTGEEEYSEVEPSGPLSVPAIISGRDANAHLRGMFDVLAEECVARGATRPPNFQTTKVELGSPIPDWLMNSTMRYQFPHLRKRK